METMRRGRIFLRSNCLLRVDALYGWVGVSTEEGCEVTDESAAANFDTPRPQIREDRKKRTGPRGVHHLAS